MKQYPYIYIGPDTCQGSHDGGWQTDQRGASLPPVKAWIDSLPEAVFAADKLCLLLSDTFLHPLRISLEEKVKPAELPQFLAWKLKRFLPWPADQVSLRYLALGEADTWLTFSLPKPWIDGVFAAFRERGVHCGYLGGAFGTLLEHQPRLKNHTNLCFFDDSYLAATLDGAGNYQAFASRRLPFTDTVGGELDTETLRTQDLAGFLDNADQPIQIFDFAPGLGADILKLCTGLRRNGLTVNSPRLSGNILSRLTACLHDGEVWP